MSVKKEVGLYPISGDVCRFVSTAKLPLTELEVNLEPEQDLHGYDYPWAPGAGINKIPYPFYHSSSTINGITWTVNSDGTVTANGTATGATSEFVLLAQAANVPFKAGTYVLSGVSGGSSTTYMIQWNPTGQTVVTCGDGQKTFTLASDTVGRVALKVANGTTVNNVVFKPMLELGSIAHNYAPYSNVCQITGHNSVTVYVSPNTKTDEAKTYTVEFTEEGTVYGGTIDLVSGLLTVTMAFKEFNGSEEWSISGTGTNQQRYTLNLSPNGKSYANAVSNEFKLATSTATRQAFGLFIISNSGNLIVYDTANVHASIDAFKTWLGSNHMQLAYELATPITYQLTPLEIETLEGFNYIWSEEGKINLIFQYYTGGEGMSITFLDCWTYPKAKIDEFLSEINARLEALEETTDDSQSKLISEKTLIEETNTEPITDEVVGE